MHKYLRSIGFSDLKDDFDTEVYLERAVNDKNLYESIPLEKGRRLEQYQLEVAPSMGISVVGTRDEFGRFHRDYYFPYMRSYDGTMTEAGSVERYTERETSYAGVLDDFRDGNTLIFYLCNSVEMRGLELEKRSVRIRQAFLTGLSESGKILLPVEKTEQDEAVLRKRQKEQSALFEAARNGDEDAIETLTESDMNLMSEVSDRLTREDLYSVVESTFLPTGVECDQYLVIGDITGLRVKENVYTHENVVDLRLKCMDSLFHICVNEKDLLGVPAIGRRFKGRIWMQGDVEMIGSADRQEPDDSEKEP